MMMLAIELLTLIAVVSAAKLVPNGHERYRNVEELEELTKDVAEERIVGGQEATAHSFPYMVSIQANIGGRGMENRCAGTIINEWTILTQAYCCRVFKFFNPDVVAGEHKVTVDEGSEQRVKVGRVVIHPNYNVTNFHNDICLAILKDPLVLNSEVQKVKLPTRGYGSPDNIGLLAGWGKTRNDTNEKAVLLRSVNLPILPDQTCLQHYTAPVVQKGWNTKSFICVGANGNGTHGDSGMCIGDAGSPLMCEGSGGVQCGMVSWATVCGHYPHPGVFVEIAHYLDFIEQNKKQT